MPQLCAITSVAWKCYNLFRPQLLLLLDGNKCGLPGELEKCVSWASAPSAGPGESDCGLSRAAET